MQAFDPEFDVINLHYEFEEVFKEFYCNFLSGNLEYLEKVCADAGLAIVKGDIKAREVGLWKYKYCDFLDCGQVNFMGGQVPEKRPPQFTFTITVQEINCRVSLKNENEIVEGDDSMISNITYSLSIQRHDDEPDIALTGHYWQIVAFEKVGEVKQLV